MWRRAVLVFLVAAACGAAAPSRPRGLWARRGGGRIVGGQPADISEFPWQVSVQQFGQHICGGSVIASTWVLSAAHCFWDAQPSDFTVRAGTSTRESGGTVYELAGVQLHEAFTITTAEYDIAVVSISGSFSFGDSVQAVSLGTADLEPQTSVTITGWGALDYTQTTLPTQLQAVSTGIVERRLCNLYYLGIITENMICAGETGRGACNGDSGGPLVIGSTQYGIVSMGYCARASFPEVYTSVAALRSWISAATGI